MWMFIVLVLFPLSVWIFRRLSISSSNRICIVVVGDIGRSPRMQYHALSFAGAEFEVDIVGYGGSQPHRDVLNNHKIHFHYMLEPPSGIQRLPKLIGYASKVFWQVVTLCWNMLLCHKPSHMLLQNPPSMPALAVCWMLSKLSHCPLVIDWHNYGYTILGISLGLSHPLVRVLKWYEHFFGRFADANLCVTKAMKEDLSKNWNVRAVTMYDRPPAVFRTVQLSERHDLFRRLAKKYESLQSEDGNPEGTLITDQNGKYKPNRPAVIVSSTSWTEDEDFSILLQALEKYDDIWKKEGKNQHLPKLICIITGKGPMKKYYTDIIAERSPSWESIAICTPWLTAEDYPLLLGSADLGVCLHTSSSGLDLPMKVVDMFGTGLPVCAIHFNCLHELVEHDKNGLVFHDSEELSDQIQCLLSGFPGQCERLATFRQNLSVFQQRRWNQAWTETVLPMFS